MTQDADRLVLHWRAHPDEFARQMFGVELDRWQLEAMTALNVHDRIAIRSGHGVGKTAFFAITIIWWLFTRTPCKVLATAPSSYQLENVLWAEVAKWHMKMPDAFRDLLIIKSDSIEFAPIPRANVVLARTARKERPEAFQGFHDPNMLFMIDEASGVDDLIFETGMGSMSTPGAKVLMAGNPTRRQGFFYDAFHSQNHLWKTFHVSCANAKMVTPDYAVQMADMYGDDSNIYRIRVLGEFPTDEDDVVIPLSWIQSAVDRDVEQIDGKVIWGVDVGGGGDESALAKRRRNVLLEPVKRWNKADTMQTVGIVVMEYEKTSYKDRPDVIMVDSIGIGAGVAHRLREQGFPARAVNVGELPATPGDKQKFVRKRDELWWRAREWFQERECRIPDDPKTIAELAMPLWQATSTGKIMVEGKYSMRKFDQKRAASGRSPNGADAFNLTFATSDRGISSRQINYPKLKVV